MMQDFLWAFSFSLLWWMLVYSVCALAEVGARHGATQLAKQTGERVILTPGQVAEVNPLIKRKARILWGAMVVGYVMHMIVVAIR